MGKGARARTSTYFPLIPYGNRSVYIYISFLHSHSLLFILFVYAFKWQNSDSLRWDSVDDAQSSRMADSFFIFSFYKFQMSERGMSVSWAICIVLSIDFPVKFMGLNTQGRKTELHYSCTIASRYNCITHLYSLLKAQTLFYRPHSFYSTFLFLFVMLRRHPNQTCTHVICDVHNIQNYDKHIPLSL